MANRQSPFAIRHLPQSKIQNRKSRIPSPPFPPRPPVQFPVPRNSKSSISTVSSLTSLPSVEPVPARSSALFRVFTGSPSLKSQIQSPKRQAAASGLSSPKVFFSLPRSACVELLLLRTGLQGHLCAHPAGNASFFGGIRAALFTPQCTLHRRRAASRTARKSRCHSPVNAPSDRELTRSGFGLQAPFPSATASPPGRCE